jgi:hypothetical protein
VEAPDESVVAGAHQPLAARLMHLDADPLPEHAMDGGGEHEHDRQRLRQPCEDRPHEQARPRRREQTADAQRVVPGRDLRRVEMKGVQLVVPPLVGREVDAARVSRSSSWRGRRWPAYS